jgi:hypothetical protein
MCACVVWLRNAHRRSTIITQQQPQRGCDRIAQGCEVRATLGRSKRASNSERVESNPLFRPFFYDTTLSGLARRNFTQGSSCLATLGCMIPIPSGLGKTSLSHFQRKEQFALVQLPSAPLPLRKKNDQRFSSSYVTACPLWLFVCGNRPLVCSSDDKECKSRTRFDTLAYSDFHSSSTDHRLGLFISLRAPSALKLNHHHHRSSLTFNPSFGRLSG